MVPLVMDAECLAAAIPLQAVLQSHLLGLGLQRELEDVKRVELGRSAAVVGAGQGGPDGASEEVDNGRVVAGAVLLPMQRDH